MDDAITLDGQPALLAAHLEREPVIGLADEIEDATIAFLVNGERVGSSTTDGAGRAAVLCHLLKGGTITYEARVTVDRQELHAAGTLFHWRKDWTILAVDIDDTICRPDVSDLVFEDVDDDSEMVEGSRRTLCGLAEDFHILYLTRRPRFLLEKTRLWLNRHGYPQGPVFTTPGLRQALRGKKFKRRTLALLRNELPNLLIGIGDKESDVKAYHANNMFSVRISPEKDDKSRYESVRLRDWGEVASMFQINREIFTQPTLLAKRIRENAGCGSHITR